jgi:hypothetical protein
MPRKPPEVERKLILARDERGKYGSRLTFQVQKPEDIGGLEHVTLLLDDDTLATIQPARIYTWESAKRYDIRVESFPTANEAEAAALQIAQSLLLWAVSLNFGLRLNYHPQ